MTELPEWQPHSDMAEQVGPFYDTAGVLSWLGITSTDLDERRARHAILICSTADGQQILPTWQFQTDGTLLPGLRDVLEILASGTHDEWTWALWLTSRVPYQLDGKSAAQWLAEGRDPSSVTDLARQDASSWAR